MELLYGYKSMLQDQENDSEVLSLLWSIEHDVFIIDETVELRRKVIEALRKMGENQIVDEVQEGLDSIVSR